MKHVILIYKKGPKEDPGNCRPISHSSVPGQVMERVFLESITNQIKQVTGKKQNGFTKDKSCQSNLITFYNKITFSVDMGSAVDVVYLVFSQVFDTVSHSLPLDLCGWGAAERTWGSW